jgi:hypothetical protein
VNQEDFMLNLMLCFLVFFSTLMGEAKPAFITPDLLQLLKALNVTHDGTAPSIAAETQKKWTRPAGKERWEVQDTLTTAERQAVFDYCTKQGFFSEINSSRKEYDYGIILGGSVGRMEKRIGHFVKLAEAGVHFKHVVLLSGARPLDPNVESIPPGCKTEGDALMYLWKGQTISKDFTWKFFEHPMIATPDGHLRRPTTVDTYSLWLKSSPIPGACLFFSNQPYCHYQNVVAEALMPKGFSVETAGMKADPNAQNGVVLLDTIAAWIQYEAKK